MEMGKKIMQQIFHVIRDPKIYIDQVWHNFKNEHYKALVITCKTTQ